MHISKENNRGVTLISLVITIIVMLIVSTIAIISGTESADTIKLQRFFNQMQLIQARVDVVYSKLKNGEITVEELGGVNYNDKQQLIDNIIQQAGATGSNSDFRYYTKEDLSNYLGLEDIKINVIINWVTREVISAEAMEIEGQYYYKYADSYQQEYVENEQQEIGIIEQIESKDSIKRVTINVENNNDNEFILKYKLKNEETWKIADENYFETAIPGEYIVEVSGNNIKTTSKDIILKPEFTIQSTPSGDANITYTLQLGFGIYKKEEIEFKYRIKDSSDTWNNIEGNSFTMVDDSKTYEVQAIYNNIKSEMIYTH